MHRVSLSFENKKSGKTLPLADLGGVPGARPLWDPILLFLHTFSPKSIRIRGPRPPMGARPPTGNPGSATDYTAH